MLDHHLQKAIVNMLKSNEELSFTALKPDDIDNKLFTYHLKIVIREGFVDKTTRGTYRLTPAGQKLWKRMSESPEQISTRAFPVLYLIIHDKNKGWLLYRRKTHPFIGKVAFMHATPTGEYTASEQAKQETLRKTGLRCNYRVIGSGFFRTYNDTALDGFVNFTALYCEHPEGELRPQDPDAEYFWDREPDSDELDMLPNMPHLLRAMQTRNKHFFLDEKVSL